MRRIRALDIVVICLLSGTVYCQEDISLEELKEKAQRNNLRIRMAQKELEMYSEESSIINNIRATASYNFETDARFYGITCSIPFGFFKARKAAVEYKRLEVEKVRVEVMREMEDLYIRYKLLIKEIEVYRLAYSEAGLRYKLAQEDFKYDRILKEDFIGAEKDYIQAFYERFRIEEEIARTRDMLCEMAGDIGDREF